MDRTKEFLRLTSEIQVVPRKPPTPSPQTEGSKIITNPKERTKQALYFTEKAADVSKGIHSCSILLGRLTQLARSQTLFNDPADEMSVLSVKVKTEISTLKSQLSELEKWLKKNDLGTGKDAKLHSEQVVKSMEYKLQDSGKQFVQVLESRKTALKAQSQRKKLFGDEDDEDDDIGKPLPQSTFTTKNQQLHNNNEEEMDEEMGLIKRSNASNPQHPPVMYTSENVIFQQQAQLIPDQQYLRSRVDAISTVESHIAELGEVMSTLTGLISQQDEMITVIGDGVDRAHLDVRAGFLQLEKYYESIRGNKRLMSRLFGVFVLFLLFFLFFLA